MIGAEAALLLLEEMESMPDTSGVAPDIFTYTTVISGVARAEVSLNSLNSSTQTLRRVGKSYGHAHPVSYFLFERTKYCPSVLLCSANFCVLELHRTHDDPDAIRSNGG